MKYSEFQPGWWGFPELRGLFPSSKLLKICESAPLLHDGQTAGLLPLPDGRSLAVAGTLRGCHRPTTGQECGGKASSHVGVFKEWVCFKSVD